MLLFSRRQHDFDCSDVPESSPIQKKTFPKAMLAFEPYCITNFHQIWTILGSSEEHQKRSKAPKRRLTKTIENEVAKIGPGAFPKPCWASPLGHPGTSEGGTWASWAFNRGSPPLPARSSLTIDSKVVKILVNLIQRLTENFLKLMQKLTEIF